jgi:hypothetical protein
MYLATGGDCCLNQGRTAAGKMFTESSIRRVVIAKADVVTRMLIPGVEVQKIDAHYFFATSLICNRLMQLELLEPA